LDIVADGKLHINGPTDFGETGGGAAHDTIFYSHTSGATITHDVTDDTLEFVKVDIQLCDGDLLNFGTGAGAAGDVSIWFDDDSGGLQIYPTGAAEAFTIGAASHVMNTTLTGTFTVGVDNTGYDVKLFGATASHYLLWDEDVDDLILAGGANLNVGDGGNLFVGAAAVPGTTAASNWIGIEDSGTDPAGTLTNSLAIYTPDAGDSLDFLHADGTTDSLGT